MTAELDRVLYTATAAVTGGRTGHGATDDGALEVDLRAPESLGGPGGGTNPEQLFAVGYAACFLSALGGVARAAKVDVSQASIVSQVDLGKAAHRNRGCSAGWRIGVEDFQDGSSYAAHPKDLDVAQRYLRRT